VAAHENLRGEQFFHGTSHDFSGDTLHPSSVHGTSNYDYGGGMYEDSASERVFMIQSGGREKWGEDIPASDAESHAWRWAGSEGRKRVHVVEPHGEVEEDMAAETGAVMAPSAKIKDTLWTPSPQAVRESLPDRTQGLHRSDAVVQGTFPEVDWNTTRELEPGKVHVGPDTVRDLNYRAYSPSYEHSEQVAREEQEWTTARRAARKQTDPPNHVIGQQQFGGF
jgi:hypothetical protein